MSDAPRPSPELLAVARRWFQAAMERRDPQLKHFLSQSDALRFVGSAEGEIWAGPAVRRAIDAHFQEIPRVLNYKEIFAEAHERNGVGWTFFVNRFWFETRDFPIDFHSTLIFVLEDNVWKIVLRHASIPSPNMEATGHEHAAIQALVDAAQQGFALGQREGLASVMFTDIVGSSPLASALGDRVWSSRVGEHFAQVRDIVEQNTGQFVKSLGDGTLSSFSSAASALSAATDIQRAMDSQTEEPFLQLRIGIHTGDVVQSDDDFFGNVVNKAARITAAAAPGTIAISDVTRAMVGGASGFTFSDPQNVRLKGFEGTHAIHRLEWRA